jgi:hypothetical protein
MGGGPVNPEIERFSAALLKSMRAPLDLDEQDFRALRLYDGEEDRAREAHRRAQLKSVQERPVREPVREPPRAPVPVVKGVSPEALAEVLMRAIHREIAPLTERLAVVERERAADRETIERQAREIETLAELLAHANTAHPGAGAR